MTHVWLSQNIQAVFRDGDSVLKAIAFSQGDRIEELKKHRRCRLAFKPIINDFNSRCSVEMQVLDFHFPD